MVITLGCESKGSEFNPERGQTLLFISFLPSTAVVHCKGLQGITGALQGNWVTGIPHLQGFVMCHFTCNY